MRLNVEALEAAIDHVRARNLFTLDGAIAEGISKYLSASLPADAAELVERLEARSKSLNGSLVGASDGATYALGFYDQFAAKDDREAASLIQSQAARIAELETFIEKARDFTKPKPLYAPKEANTDA